MTIDGFHRIYKYPFLIQFKGQYFDEWHLIANDTDMVNAIKHIYPIAYSDNEYHYVVSYNNTSDDNYSIENEFLKQYDMPIAVAKEYINKYPESIIADHMGAAIKQVIDADVEYKKAAQHKIFHDDVIDKLDDLRTAIDVFHWLRVECSDFIVKEFYTYRN